MSEKVSLKTIYVISLILSGIVLILGACMEPVDVNAFLDDKTVKDVIKNNQKSVKLTADSPDYLKAGDSKITGLRSDGYYMIESEKDEDSNTVPNTLYPTPNKYPRFVFETGQSDEDLTVIKRVTGRTIINLRNDHLYKVREAVAFTGTEPTITVGDATKSKTGNVITVTPNVAGVTTITLGGFSSAYDDYEVMGVAVSGITNNIVSKFTSGAKTIGTGAGKVTSFDLEVPATTAKTVVDYVFAKGSGDKFEYLTVEVKPFGASGGDIPISLTTINVLTAPVAGATPLTPAIDTAQYTGTVAWTGNPTTFGADTVYTATITLAPKPGFKFDGLTTTSFTVTGASSAAFNSSTGVITAPFPKTAETIDNLNITVLTAPKAGATPSTVPISNGQYTGVMAWTGDPTVFDADTVYTATITLTVGSGYTLYGLTATSFTVAGASSANLNLTTGVITVTFPRTAKTITKPFNITPTYTGTVKDTLTLLDSDNEYTGTVAWTVGTESGPSFTGATFAANTIYVAKITLTANTGYTTYGMPSDVKTLVIGATTATFNSGTNVITAIFPATGSKPEGSGKITITFTTPSEKFTGGSTNITVTGAGSASFTVNTTGIGTVNKIEWYQDGNKLLETTNILALNSITTDLIGIHVFMVFVEVDGVPYSAKFVLTVTE